EHKKNVLSAELVELARIEDEEAYQAVKQAPKQSPFSLGSPALRARERRQKKDRELTNVEANLRAVQRALAEERAKVADETLSEMIAGLTYNDEEIALWEKAGEVFERLLDTYLSIGSLAEARDALPATIDTPNNELRVRYERAVSAPIQPHVKDIGAFVQLLVRASCDVHGEGRGEPGQVPIDDNRLLGGLLPDLRHENRNLTDLGR